MRVRTVLSGFALVVGCVGVAAAQDAAKVDSAHYKVMSENAEVRILHVHYGPHEKSVMHSHPDGVVVFLTAGKTKFTYPDGKTEVREMKAGDAMYTPHTVHLPENVSDHAMDAVLVELKK
ncbi:MAG TPA: cupin domain-containing protein [Acidobacteriaceae bacterium]|nr:cupin domain-containing protein [Acidobacteriaceae bacterium]